MTATDKVTIERCSARTCANGALNKLGSGSFGVSPYWFHSLQQALTTNVFPYRVLERLLYQTVFHLTLSLACLAFCVNSFCVKLGR